MGSDHSGSGNRKVSLEDPTWKVLPAALKKYKLDGDHWQDYALFICYGSLDHRRERCLNYDEKPLLIFQKLKDAKKNPIFMLKHISEIHSPIAMARQKHDHHQTSASLEHATPPNSSTAPDGPLLAVTGEPVACPMLSAPSRSQPFSNTSHRDCFDNLKNLKVSLEDTTRKVLPAALKQYTLDSSHWQDYAMFICYGPPENRIERCLSYDEKPLLLFQKLRGAKKNPVFVVKHIKDIRPPIAVVQKALGSCKVSLGQTSTNNHGTARGSGTGTTASLSTDISYAVAIYPYLAEREGEFDVAVGDTFVIITHTRAWLAVQRDPTGFGFVDPGASKQGWVPTGCLLETNVPVGSAIAEATAFAKATGFLGLPGKKPILPLRIVSSSFLGIALMDYNKKGEEELDLQTDDVLSVFKLHHHWSYVVKQDGTRGWAPSWFIGKTSASPTSDLAPPEKYELTVQRH